MQKVDYKKFVSQFLRALTLDCIVWNERFVNMNTLSLVNTPEFFIKFRVCHQHFVL